MNKRTARAVSAFAAVDPARAPSGTDDAERRLLLRNIVATTAVPLVPTRGRRRRARSIGLAVAIFALVGAGSVAALNGGLPIGNDRIVKSASEAREEAAAAAREIPVAPGERDPGAGPLDPDATYAQGAAAGQLLFRRMCTWDKQLLQAVAAGDTRTIVAAKAELSRPLWYMYFAPESADDVRAMHANARAGHTGTLRQFYDVNCRDVTG